MFDAARTALNTALIEGARTDPAVWCQLSTLGRWTPAPHALYMLDQVRTNCEHAGRTIISVSVRHSKTETITRGFSSWWLGTHPDDRIIHGTAEADLAEANSAQVRDRLTMFGPTVFGVDVDASTSAKRRWDLTSPHTGGMTAVGRGGSPEGRGGHILIDDPYRNFADAMSPAVRNMVRDWWTNSLRPRMEPGAWAIVICSRWHTEDLTGWLLKEFGEEWSEIRLPAIADSPDDPMERPEGTPLWPERWPLHELERARRETISDGGEITWAARYQQRPVDMSATMFPADRWLWVADLAELDTPRGWCRAWDLAATEAGGDWTVGALIGALPDGRFVVADVVRAQLGPDGVRSLLARTAAADRVRYPGITWRFPQDPGQAGKDQAQQLVRLVAPLAASAQPVTGSKEVRAAGWSSQQRAGNVIIVDTPETRRMVATHAAFPGGVHDDDVDAAADAFNAIALTAGASTSFAAGLSSTPML